MTSTCVLASVVGRAAVVAVAVVVARLVPKREAMDPELTTPSLEKLAPFTKPPGKTVGTSMAKLTVSSCGLLAAPEPGIAVIVTVPE